MPHSNPSGRHWPWSIAIGLLIVVLVNVIFAYVAIAGADDVVPSYTTEAR